MCQSESTAHGQTRSTQAPPRFKPELQVLRTLVEAATYRCVSVPLPFTAASPPAETSTASEQAASLGVTWFAVLPSWDLQQEGGQWWVYAQHISSSGIRKSYPVTDTGVHWVDDPEWGSEFFFQSCVQATNALWFSKPSGANMARAYSHFALVQLFFFPSIGSDPQSCCKQKLVVPSLGPDF